jgi:ferredoxin
MGGSIDGAIDPPEQVVDRIRTRLLNARGGTLSSRASARSSTTCPLAATLQEELDEMAYVIAEPCIDVLDVSCVSVCPVDCIHFDEGTDRKLFIDPNECIDCGACEPECPVNAIFPEESLPAEWANYTAIDATWFTDKAAARAAVDELKPA